MDQLGAIELFNKVVETGSFSAAGRQSNLAPSSVSRRIVDLEGWLGATLFHRTTRKLNLTEDNHNISPFKSNDSKATVALSPSAIAAVCGCT